MGETERSNQNISYEKRIDLQYRGSEKTTHSSFPIYLCWLVIFLELFPFFFSFLWNVLCVCVFSLEPPSWKDIFLTWQLYHRWTVKLWKNEFLVHKIIFVSKIKLIPDKSCFFRNWSLTTTVWCHLHHGWPLLPSGLLFSLTNCIHVYSGINCFSISVF